MRFNLSKRSMALASAVTAGVMAIGGPALADCIKPTEANPSVDFNNSVSPDGCVWRLEAGGDTGIKSFTVNGQVETLPWTAPKPGVYNLKFTYEANAHVKNPPQNGNYGSETDMCGPEVVPDDCTVKNVRGAVKKRDKCRTRGDRFAVRKEAGVVYKVNGRTLPNSKEGKWLKTNGKRKIVITAHAAKAPDGVKNVLKGERRWVLKFSNKPCNKPRNPLPTGHYRTQG